MILKELRRTDTHPLNGKAFNIFPLTCNGDFTCWSRSRPVFYCSSSGSGCEQNDPASPASAPAPDGVQNVPAPAVPAPVPHPCYRAYVCTIASKINITPVWLYVRSECPHPVDAPVVANGLPVRTDWTSRRCEDSLQTQPDRCNASILEAIVPAYKLCYKAHVQVQVHHVRAILVIHVVKFIQINWVPLAK